MSFTQHFVNCKVCTWVLLNTLLQFHEFFLTLYIFVDFNNVNTVRSEMWVWGFPNHSCQKFLTNHLSSTRDLTRFWHLWFEKPHTHISSSQYCLNVYILAFFKAKRQILAKGIQMAKKFKFQLAKIIAIAIWQNFAMSVFARIKKRSSKGSMREVREWKKVFFFEVCAASW